jgi:hypothetical protein
LFAEVITGAASTVSVKLWDAVPALLVAVSVIGYTPPCVGVPESTPALSPTPVGSVPVSVIVGLGKPVAVTGKLPAVPSVNVALLAEVMVGLELTVSVKLCAENPALLVAVNEIGKVPVCVGVPESTPPLNVTPVGSVPVSVIVGLGKPVAVTGKLPAVPSVNVVLLADVIAGASLTVRLVVPDDSSKFESPEYVAVIVSEPVGAFVAEHDPEPSTRASVVHSVVAPLVKVTVPVGVPLASEVTVAE